MAKSRKTIIGLSIFIIVIIIGLIALVTVQNNASKGSGNGAPKQTITIGSKNFTESIILGEMYADALENAGYKVNRKLNLGGTLVAHEALKKGDIDMYPEYTGTGLLDILKENKLTDADAVYKEVAKQYKDKWNLIWLNPSKANDSNGLAVSKKISDKYNIHTFSDFARESKKINFASTPEFDERADGLKGLKATYGGFNFKSSKIYDYGLRYQLLENGKADAIVAFTTDGQLTNKNVVLLEDNKHFYPPYFVCPVIRANVIKKDPNVQKVINAVSAKLTEKNMQEMNAQVDLQKQKYQDVAKQFLIDNDLIKK
ncbi:glycine/betaine ABC transporter substrate-binding protein [Sporolactobacillus shoreicorticis]|uniref:Glycine betaine ABC transporter substrate-binding protein n=1 Tax=Sporolactobacillus shoreicorticis TaxID=1923877 RepID=A0ABW5S3Q2_9BACL|nr:glycine betaine ABC transporter substrate-binding protein [Sporolactobacillus shoreicorticis]MCO7124293.1 glycine/betaine ABC transporter substrate-binding protein [Sporolactobacillus shoreicorticis]